MALTFEAASKDACMGEHWSARSLVVHVACLRVAKTVWQVGSLVNSA